MTTPDATPAAVDSRPASVPGARVDEPERLRRWRLLLGTPADASTAGGAGRGLGQADQVIDAALAALYDTGPAARERGPRSAGRPHASDRGAWQRAWAGQGLAD